MKARIHISVIYTDEHLIELSINASNGVFAGQAQVYANSDVLARCALELKGFPSSQSDVREFEFGSFDAAHAGGGARFRFFCLDSVGHSAVEVSLRTDPKTEGGVSDTVALHILIEAAAMDSFVGQLERMEPMGGNAAILE